VINYKTNQNQQLSRKNINNEFKRYVYREAVKLIDMLI